MMFVGLRIGAIRMWNCWINRCSIPAFYHDALLSNFATAEKTGNKLTATKFGGCRNL